MIALLVNTDYLEEKGSARAKFYLIPYLAWRSLDQVSHHCPSFNKRKSWLLTIPSLKLFNKQNWPKNRTLPDPTNHYSRIFTIVREKVEKFQNYDFPNF